jgi:hypothetical protein
MWEAGGRLGDEMAGGAEPTAALEEWRWLGRQDPHLGHSQLFDLANYPAFS